MPFSINIGLSSAKEMISWQYMQYDTKADDEFLRQDEEPVPSVCTHSNLGIGGL